ncbi:MAG: hypothetical protein NTV25_08270 [Methanothrix sp.]|nr:hypothetical protein [Methanothrix sp.]
MMGERFHIPAHSKVFGRLRDGISQAAAYTVGFNANKTEELLGLPNGEVPIGVLPVGRKA